MSATRTTFLVSFCAVSALFLAGTLGGASGCGANGGTIGGSAGGNGSSTVTQETAVTAGSVSTIDSSVAAAINSTLADAGVTALTVNPTDPGFGPGDHPDSSAADGSHPGAPGDVTGGGDGQGTDGADTSGGGDAFDNCQKTQNPDGSFSVTCDCHAGDTTQGTVTHTFNKAMTHGTCTRGDGSTGPTLSMDGTVTTTFDNCIVEQCGDTLTLSGTVTGAIAMSVDTCAHQTSFTVDFSTVGQCGGQCDATNGLTTTLPDGTTHETCLQATVSRTGGPQTVSGSICTDGGTAIDFSSMDSLKQAIDPNGTCDQKESCEESCVASCGTGSAPALDAGDQPSSCEESCSQTCEAQVEGS